MSLEREIYDAPRDPPETDENPNLGSAAGENYGLTVWTPGNDASWIHAGRPSDLER